MKSKWRSWQDPHTIFPIFPVAHDLLEIQASNLSARLRIIRRGLFFLSLFIGISVAWASENRPGNQLVTRHVEKEVPYALERILRSFVGVGGILFGGEVEELVGIPGAIVAAPSLADDPDRGETQDYRWRWKRDSAITMRLILRAMKMGELKPLSGDAKIQLMRAYVDFCEREQLAHRVESGVFALGHAKATLTAEPNPFPWGYPQNDGPPLEILTLVEVLQLMETLPVRDSDLQAKVVRVWARNLDYILRTYKDPAVERWEEVKAHSHFSILVESRAALKASLKILPQLQSGSRIQGGKLRRKILNAIADMEAAIKERHIDPAGYIRSHFGQITEGSLVRDKESALDMQVLMTSVYLNKLGEMSDTDHFYPPSHPLMRATFHLLKEAFIKKYPINSYGMDMATQEGLRGLVFGRYPEDVQHFNGAPWFITTFAAVQFLVWDAIHIHRHGVEISELDKNYFRGLNPELGENDLASGKYGPLTWQSVRIRDGLIRLAKEVFYRATIHIGDTDLSLSEVLNPRSGYKEGIQHLTWSYVEYVKTVRMLRRAQADFGLDLKLRIPDVSCEAWLNPG